MFKSVREVLTQVSNSKTQEVHKQIVNEILTNFDNNIFLKQKELAEACFVSESTITLLAKSLGYDGYRELYLRLKIESEYYHFNDLQNQQQVSRKQPNAYRNLIDTNFNYIDGQQEQINIFVKQIKKYKSIYIFSSYEQENNVQFFASGLRRFNKTITFEPIRYWDFWLINDLQKDDLAIFIITGLDNENLIQTYNNLILKGVKILVITTPSQATKIENPTAIVELGNRGKEPTVMHNRNIVINYLFSNILMNL